MKIKIAYVIPQLNFGGAQTMLVRLIKNIDFVKFDVKLFICGKKLSNGIEKEMENIGISYDFLDIDDNVIGMKKVLYKLYAYFCFQKALNEFKPDIVHNHLDNFYSFLYCILNRKKMVFTIHSWPDRLASNKMKYYINTLNRKKSIWLIGVAQTITVRVKEVLLNNNEAVVTIYNPIELEKYKRKNVVSEQFTYLHIGRLTPIKNQALLLNAFSDVLKEKSESRLVIVGDGELRLYLEELTKKLEIQENVSFYGNRIDIPELLSCADAFVLSSDSEACPVTVLEAMASAVPVIATNVGGIHEQLGCDLLLAERKNQESLKNMMILVQTSEKVRETVINSELKQIKEFDARRIGKLHENLYDEIYRM